MRTQTSASTWSLPTSAVSNCPVRTVNAETSLSSSNRTGSGFLHRRACKLLRPLLPARQGQSIDQRLHLIVQIARGNNPPRESWSQQGDVKFGHETHPSNHQRFECRVAIESQEVPLGQTLPRRSPRVPALERWLQPQPRQLRREKPPEFVLVLPRRRIGAPEPSSVHQRKLHPAAPMHLGAFTGPK